MPTTRFTGSEAWVPAAVAAGLALLVVFTVAELFVVDAVPGRDAVNLYFWELHTRTVLASGALPHWNAYHFAGAPHLADPQTTVLYPPAMALRWLEPTTFFTWMAAVHVWWMGMGVLVLARTIGLGWPAAATGAVGVMLGGGTGPWLHNGYLLLLYCAAWLPWVLAFAIVSARRDQLLPHPGLIASLVMVLLAGYLQGALYVAAVVALYFAWTATSRGLRPLLQLAVIAVLAAGASAFQLLPTAGLVSSAARTAGLEYADALEGAWTFRDLARVWLPFYGIDSLPHRAIADGAVYVGWTLACLAPVAFFDATRRRLVWFLAALTAGALALALGDELGLYRWHHALFPALRGPARLLFLATLGLGVLGAIGLERSLAALTARRWRSRAVGAAAVAALVLTTVDVSAYVAGAPDPVEITPVETIEEWLGPPAPGRTVSLCENVIGAGELLGARRETLDGLAGIPARGYADWTYLVRTGQRPPDDGLYRRVNDQGGFPARRDLLDLSRVTTILSCGEITQSAITLAHRTAQLRVYANETAWPPAVWTCGTAEVSHAEAIDRLLSGRYDGSRRLVPVYYVNVRWAMSLPPARRRAAEERYDLRAGDQQDGSTWRYILGDTTRGNITALLADPLVEDTHGLDRERRSVVKTAAPVPGDAPRDELLIGAAECAGDGVVAIRRRTANGAMEVAVESSAPGHVFVSDARYSERRAFVDGVQVEPRTANLGLTAIPVPAGRHIVELRYVPVRFYAGLLVSAVTIGTWTTSSLLGSARRRARRMRPAGEAVA